MHKTPQTPLRRCGKWAWCSLRLVKWCAFMCTAVILGARQMEHTGGLWEASVPQWTRTWPAAAVSGLCSLVSFLWAELSVRTPTPRSSQSQLLGHNCFCMEFYWNTVTSLFSCAAYEGVLPSWWLSHRTRYFMAIKPKRFAVWLSLEILWENPIQIVFQNLPPN